MRSITCKTRYYELCFAMMFIFLNACTTTQDTEKKEMQDLAQHIQTDATLDTVYNKARELIRSGFNAGDGYSEVWIRDYNTFIEISSDVMPAETVRENLLLFFKFQGEDGNIVDGFVPYSDPPPVGYDYIFSDLAPGLAAHKNTVETDQESSLIQAVWKYINRSGDQSILNETIAGETVLNRMIRAMEFLMKERFDEKYGLIWGATTADWGDVQPEHEWGVYLTEDTHYAIDIYDNAMFLIALQNLIALLPDNDTRRGEWQEVHDTIRTNVREHLWDGENQKFIPHIYLEDSPFPDDFDENKIHYHGGTAVAIEAGLLSKEEIEAVNKQMLANIKASGAPSIGLTVYPPYPEGFFKNKGMYPYGYQNGGDWTWFGGRMIQQLIRNGFVKEAYAEIRPMIDRVIENDGFYEWYTVDGKPTGSGQFRGSAGVLARAVEMLREWSHEVLKQ